MRKQALILRLLGTLAVAFPAGEASATSAVGAAPFESDEHTLLLIDFEDGLNAAFARGSPLSSGSMELVEGRFGRGARARPGAFEQGHLLAAPFFRMVRYQHGENFPAAQGTLEMWVRPYFDRSDTLDQPTAPHLGNDYYLFHFAISPGHRDIALFLREWMTPDGIARTVGFRDRTARRTAETHQMFSARDLLISGQWHHIAVTWGPHGRTLFLNGQVAASLERRGSLPAFGPTARPMAVGSMATYSSRPASADIDEVRISDVVRYRKPFAVESPE